MVPGRGEPGTLGPVGDDDSSIAELDGSEADDRALEPISDALPPLDVSAPNPPNSNCADAGATLIYVVTEGFELMSFYPPTATFASIGTLDCPNESGSTPFSMAVDQSGIAYVVYSDGELFRVSTATAACRRTKFASGQHGFPSKFGMGFSVNGRGTGETLFVVSGESDPPATSPPPGLATIGTTSFALSLVAALDPPIESAELTGTGAGDLFAFYSTIGATPCDNMDPMVHCTDSAIGQIDKTTGRVTNQTVLFGNPQGTAWAFGFWGGDFYTFTSPDSENAIVTRFRPTDGTSVVVARRPGPIVGAGVSTCAPGQ